MIRKIMFSASVALLSGCADPDIDVVKSGRLDGYPQFTVGEAFDNRKVCSETDWYVEKDDRERNIVVYKCHLLGVKEYHEGEILKLINNIKSEMEIDPPWEVGSVKNSIEFYEGEIRAEQRDIERFEGEIKKRQDYLDDEEYISYHWSFEKEIAEYKEQISEIEEKISRHRSAIVEKENELGPLWGKHEIDKINWTNEIRRLEGVIGSLGMASAYEYFHFTVADNGDFYITDAGLMHRTPAGDVYKKIDGFPDINNRVGLVYSNSLNDFKKYASFFNLANNHSWFQITKEMLEQ